MRVGLGEMEEREKEREKRVNGILGEDGQIRPWVFQAFEAFISSIHQLPLEGRDSYVGASVENATRGRVSSCSEVEKGKLYKNISQAFNTTLKNVWQQKSSEDIIHMENEVRKEEFFKLLHQATSKGEVVLNDACFLEQCSKILNLGSSVLDNPERNAKERRSVALDASNEEFNGEESLAGMELGFTNYNVQERRKRESLGPAVKSPTGKSVGAVNGAPLLPMQKGDCISENVAEKVDAIGQKTATFEDLTFSFADIVKLGKKSPICSIPCHVGISDNSKSSSVLNVPCMGDCSHVFNSTIGDKAERLGTKNTHVPLSEPKVRQQVTTGNLTHGLQCGALNENDDFTPGSAHISPDGSSLFKIEKDILQKRMEMFKFSVIGRLMLNKGEKPWLLKMLREKLEGIWGIKSPWRLVSLGKGFFHIVLNSQGELDKIWSRGPLFLKPGVLRLQRWSVDFNPLKEKTTTAQVWFRILHLPWCLWDPLVITGIARKIGFPLRIDKATLEGDLGHYARVLIEVDLSRHIKTNVIIECNQHTFEVELVPENIPSFCLGCNSIGHMVNDCRILNLPREEPKVSKGQKGGERGLMNAALVKNTSSAGAQSVLKLNDKVVGNRNIPKETMSHKGAKVHSIVETITDFSAHVEISSSKDAFSDSLIVTNKFSVLGTNENDAIDITDCNGQSSFIEETMIGNNGKENEEGNTFLPKLSPRAQEKWCNVLDEEEDIEVSPVPIDTVILPPSCMMEVDYTTREALISRSIGSTSTTPLYGQWIQATNKKHKKGKSSCNRLPVRNN